MKHLNIAYQVFIRSISSRKKQQHEYNSKVLHHGFHLKKKIEQTMFIFLDSQNLSQIVVKIDKNDQRKKKQRANERNLFFF